MTATGELTLRDERGMEEAMVCHNIECSYHDEKMTDNCSKGEPPDVDRCKNATHHHACDCREAMIKVVCETLLLAHEHINMIAIKMGYRDNHTGDRITCDCSACKAARELLK